MIILSKLELPGSIMEWEEKTNKNLQSTDGKKIHVISLHLCKLHNN